MKLLGDTPEDVRLSLRLLGVLGIVWPLMLLATVTEKLGGGCCRG